MKLSGGNMWKFRNICCDEEILKIREYQKNEKDDKVKKTCLNAIVKYNTYKTAYFELCNGNVTEINYKSKDFKAVVNWKKRSGDKAVPTKALDLKTRYHEVKNRCDITVREYLTERGYTGDEYDTVIDRLLAEAVEKSNDEDEPVEDVPTVVKQSAAITDNADACTEGI